VLLDSIRDIRAKLDELLLGGTTFGIDNIRP
jgi:hypothetical protein